MQLFVIAEMAYHKQGLRAIVLLKLHIKINRLLGRTLPLVFQALYIVQICW